MLNLFKIELNMWVEVKVADEWVIGQIVDITRDGKKVWVETHEDTYTVDRVGGIKKIEGDEE